MMENKQASPGYEEVKATIIALEKQALELWNSGNPDGFLNLSSDDVVYADPAFVYRVQGKKALEAYYEQVRGKIKIDQYSIINPTVQVMAGGAVLTYDYEAHRDGLVFRMHCTEVYSAEAGETPEPSAAAGEQEIQTVWKIIHTHWSMVMPKQQC